MGWPWTRLFGRAERQSGDRDSGGGTARRPRGFAERAAAVEGSRPLPPPVFTGALGQIEQYVAGRTLPTAPPFASAGLLGQRSRMRDRLLTRNPDSLADYEMLEMLLFFAQPKGDTKPLAQGLMNRFGSLAAVLSAPQRELLAAPGLGAHSVAALKLVQAAALRLVRAEAAGR